MILNILAGACAVIIFPGAIRWLFRAPTEPQDDDGLRDDQVW